MGRKKKSKTSKKQKKVDYDEPEYIGTVTLTEPEPTDRIPEEERVHDEEGDINEEEHEERVTDEERVHDEEGDINEEEHEERDTDERASEKETELVRKKSVSPKQPSKKSVSPCSASKGPKSASPRSKAGKRKTPTSSPRQKAPATSPIQKDPTSNPTKKAPESSATDKAQPSSPKLPAKKKAQVTQSPVRRSLRDQSSVPKENQKCKLMAISGKNEVVAEGRWASDDSEQTVHFVPLGPNAVKVWVDLVKVSTASVWKPSSEIECMGDAIGSTIAWPKDKVKMC